MEYWLTPHLCWGNLPVCRNVVERFWCASGCGDQAVSSGDLSLGCETATVGILQCTNPVGCVERVF